MTIRLVGAKLPGLKMSPKMSLTPTMTPTIRLVGTKFNLESNVLKAISNVHVSKA